ncbi:Ig-like domain-containing protein, partial [Veronia pacifica]
MVEIKINSLDDVKVAGFDMVYVDSAGTSNKFNDALVALAKGELVITKNGEKVTVDEIVKSSGVNVKSLESVFLENILTEDKTISNLVEQVQQVENQREAALKRVEELEKKNLELEKAEKQDERQKDRKEDLDESLKKISELEQSIKDVQDELAKKQSELKDKSLKQIALLQQLQKEGEPLSETVELVEKELLAAEKDNSKEQEEGEADGEKAKFLKPPKLSDIIESSSGSSAVTKAGGQPKFSEQLGGTSSVASAEQNEKFKILTEGEYVGIAGAGDFKLEVSGVDADAEEIIVTIAGQNSQGEATEITYTLTEKTGWQVPDSDISDFADGVVFITADLRKEDGEIVTATNEVTIDQTINANDDFRIALTIEGKEYNATEIETESFTFKGVEEDIASIEITLIQGDTTKKSILYSEPWIPPAGLLSEFDDGEVTIQAKMTDLAGNTSATIESSLHIDSSADNDGTPFEIELAIEDGIYNKGEYASKSFELKGFDDDAKKVLITLQQGGVNPISSSFELEPPFNIESDLFKNFRDGDVSISAVLTDDAGNTQIAASRTITIDKTADTGDTFEIKLDVADGTYNKQEVRNKSFTFDGLDADANTVRVIIEKNGSIIKEKSFAQPFDVPSNFLNDLTDSSVTVRAIVTDQAGNSKEAEARPITIDRSADTGEVFKIVPAVDGREYNSEEYDTKSFSLEGIDTDAASITVRLEQSGPPLISETLNLTAPFDIDDGVFSIFNDGEVNISAIVYDNAGNSKAAESKSIVIDKSADIEGEKFSIKLAAPDGTYNNDEYLESSFTIEGTDTDAKSVKIVIEQFGVEKVNITLDPPFTVPDNLLATLEHGDATIRATVTDDAGNTTGAVPQPIKIDVSADIDDTPFEIELAVSDLVYNASEYAVKSFALKGIDSDAKQVIITLTQGENETPVPLEPPFNVPDNLFSSFRDGEVVIRAQVIDDAGNTKNAEQKTIRIDTSADQDDETFIIKPAIEGKEYNKLEFDKKSFSFEGIDNDAKSIKFTLTQGSEKNVFEIASPFNVDPTIFSTFNSGVVKIEAIVTDTAGNTKSAEDVEIRIDREAEEKGETFAIKLDIEDALYNEKEYKEKSFTFVGTDDDIELITVTLEQAGKTPVVVPLQSPFDVSKTILSSFDDGKVTIRATVTDDAGNTFSAQPQIVTIDTSADFGDTFTIVLDNEDGIYNSEEYLEKDFTLDGIDGDATQVVITLKQTGRDPLVETLTSPDFILPEGMLSTFSDGEVTISAVVTDKAGNTQAAASQTVTIDTLAGGDGFRIVPTISGREYNHAEYKEESFMLKGIDPEAKEIRIKLTQPGATPYEQVLVTPFEVSKSILSSFSDGPVTINAVLEDNAGNTVRADTVTIDIDTSADLENNFSIQPEAPSVSGKPFNNDDVKGKCFTLTGIEADTKEVMLVLTQGDTRVEEVLTEKPFTVPDGLLNRFNDGTVKVLATIYDDAGNSYAAQIVELEKDTTADDGNDLELILANTVINDSGKAAVSVELVGQDRDIKTVTVTFSDGK